MLRISEAKKAAGVVIGIEPTLAWPEGFQTGVSHDLFTDLSVIAGLSL